MITVRRRTVGVVAAALLAAAAWGGGLADIFAGTLSWVVELAAFLAAKQPRLEEIYRDRYGAAGPTGVLHPSVTTDGDGRVKTLRWEKDTVGDAAFTAALESEIRSWKFPASMAAMTLGFDLEFDPERGVYGVDTSATGGEP
jgi:hypothetical protein